MSIELFDDWMMRVPFKLPAEFTPTRWLELITESNRPLIFLHGEGDLRQIRCHASWELRVPKFVNKAIIDFSEAKSILGRAKYRRHSSYSCGIGIGEDRADVYLTTLRVNVSKKRR